MCGAYASGGAPTGTQLFVFFLARVNVKLEREGPDLLMVANSGRTVVVCLGGICQLTILAL
jgi:hypothetical protein